MRHFVAIIAYLLFRSLFVLISCSFAWNEHTHLNTPTYKGTKLCTGVEPRKMILNRLTHSFVDTDNIGIHVCAGSTLC